MLLFTLISIVVLGGALALFTWILGQVRQVGPLSERLSVLEAEVKALRKRKSAVPAEPAPAQENFAPSVLTPNPASMLPPAPAAASPTAPPPPPPPQAPSPLPPAPTRSLAESLSPPLPIPAPALSARPAEAPLWLRWIGRNPVVMVGIIVLLLGVSFLLHLAAQVGLLPPEVRLGGASLLALGLLGVGWKKRTSHPHFALPLQGGGLGVLFLVVFAAHRVYGFLPPSLSLPIAVFLVSATGVLAALQNAYPLALLALATGFAAPIALSSGSGNFTALFTYYVILDAAVFALAKIRAWRSLHVIAFLTTYGVAVSWGASSYEAQHFARCQIFLWVFYALFSATTLAFARHQYRGIKGYVDGTLIFGLPLATLGIHSFLVEASPMPMAYAVAGMALHHLTTGLWLLRQSRVRDDMQHLRTLAETLGVMGTILGSIAIPLAFSGPWTAVTWAVEGAGLVFLGLRQGRPWTLGIGAVLSLGAVFFQWNASVSAGSTGLIISAGVCTLSLLAIAWMGDRLRTKIALPSALSALWTSFAWVLLAVELGRWCDTVVESYMSTRGIPAPVLAWILAVISSTLVLSFASHALRWSRGLWLWLPSLIIWLLLVIIQGSLVVALNKVFFWEAWGLGAFALAPALAILGLAAIYKSKNIQLHPTPRTLAGGFLGYGILAILSLELQEHLRAWDAAAAWSLALFLPTAAAYGLSRKSCATSNLGLWVPGLLQFRGLLPLVFILGGWSAAALVQSASSAYIPYIPLLNWTDLSGGAALMALLFFPFVPQRRPLLLIYALLWSGVTLNRVFHHYFGVAWDFNQLWESRSLQAAWALLLTSQALGLMFWASRSKRRTAWMAGAGLLGLAVLKLMFVDLSGQGSVARIVSFMGAGLLTIAIGYLSPLPPEEKA